MKFFERPYYWNKPENLAAYSYKCGYCSNKVSSEKGMRNYRPDTGGSNSYIYLCPSCEGPTLLSPQGNLHPSSVFGNHVGSLPVDLEGLYDEARRCTSHNCFTSAVLTCRKILMNIAVAQGAKEGLKFIEYVNYLSDSGYIPPNGKHWVDHIRKKGNEATHEIQLMSAKDAEELLVFVEMLLKFVYEFPNMVGSP